MSRSQVYQNPVSISQILYILIIAKLLTGSSRKQPNTSIFSEMDTKGIETFDICDIRSPHSHDLGYIM